MVRSIVLVYSLLALLQVKVSESQKCNCDCADGTKHTFDFESCCSCCQSGQNISCHSCYCSVVDGSRRSVCMCNEKVNNQFIFSCSIIHNHQNNITCTQSQLSSINSIQSSLTTDFSSFTSQSMSISTIMITTTSTQSQSSLTDSIQSSQTTDFSSTSQSVSISMIMINPLSSKLRTKSETISKDCVSSSIMVPNPSVSPSDVQSRTSSELIPTSQMLAHNYSNSVSQFSVHNRTSSELISTSQILAHNYSNSVSQSSIVPSESPTNEQDGNNSKLLMLLAGGIGGTLLLLLAIGVIVLQIGIIYRVRKNRVEVIETSTVQTRSEESELCLWRSGVRSPEPVSVVPVTHEAEHTYEELDEFNDKSNMNTVPSDYCIPQDRILNRAKEISVSSEIQNTCKPCCFQELECTQYTGVVDGEHDYKILESNGVSTEVTDEGASDIIIETTSTLQPEKIDIQMKTNEFAMAINGATQKYM